LTYNESSNICDSLERLSWARRIVVIDSYSSDDTVELASAFSNVRVLSRPFDNHTAQWNFGLDQIVTDWVLTLDADYRCPHELAGELAALPEADAIYLANFRYCILGKPLRGTLYPPRAVLFNARRLRYAEDGHTQRLEVGSQPMKMLTSRLLHDDRKPLTAWYGAQVRYGELEARKLFETPKEQLGWKDRLRCWYVVAPILTFFYCLFAKRLILDGRAGLYYTMQRVYAELLLGLTLLDRKLRGSTHRKDPQSSAPVYAGQQNNTWNDE
jgi:glycosyltransferase involved in cell wall biosynthesis